MTKLPHDGGPCPVAPETRVRVWLRGGHHSETDIRPAIKFNWEWSDWCPERDILFYEPLDAERTCTCHPDDGPPVPCAEKYALSECRDAPAVKADEYQPRSRGRLIEILRAQGENPRSWQAEAAAMLSSPPAPMPVVDEAAIRRAINEYKHRNPFMTALDHAEGIRAALQAALTPPSSAEDK